MPSARTPAADPPSQHGAAAWPGPGVARWRRKPARGAPPSAMHADVPSLTRHPRRRGPAPSRDRGRPAFAVAHRKPRASGARTRRAQSFRGCPPRGSVRVPTAAGLLRAVPRGTGQTPNQGMERDREQGSMPSVDLEHAATTHRCKHSLLFTRRGLRAGTANASPAALSRYSRRGARRNQATCYSVLAVSFRRRRNACTAEDLASSFLTIAEVLTCAHS